MMRHHRSAQSKITLESVAGEEWWKPPSDARRLALVRAAFEIVVEEGLEGLRTRAVAQRAGMNIATLHYYYPSKDELLAGLAAYVASLFAFEHAPAVKPSGSASIDRLRQEFADLEYYLTRRPDMLAAMNELTLRSRRDPLLAECLGRLNAMWRSGLEQMAAAGVAEGVFRQELDPRSIADVLQAALTGAIHVSFSKAALQRLFRQLEAWLLAPSHASAAISRTRTKRKR